jgi:hypothetical protein
MTENTIEHNVYYLLKECHPAQMTAEDLAIGVYELTGQDPGNKEVGDALYDGALAGYVFRTGKPPNRLWGLKTISACYEERGRVLF